MEAIRFTKEQCEAMATGVRNYIAGTVYDMNENDNPYTPKELREMMTYVRQGAYSVLMEVCHADNWPDVVTWFDKTLDKELAAYYEYIDAALEEEKKLEAKVEKYRLTCKECSYYWADEEDDRPYCHFSSDEIIPAPCEE